MSGTAPLSREPWASHGAALKGAACAVGTGEAHRGTGCWGWGCMGGGHWVPPESAGDPLRLGEGDVWFGLRSFV